MDMNALLDRLTARRTEMRMSEQEVSRAGGSDDLIRNWRRAMADGKTPSPRVEGLQKIADKLGVTVAWLTGNDAQVQSDFRFSEDARPFIMPKTLVSENGEIDPLALMFNERADHTGTIEVSDDMPALGLNAGDVLVYDMGRLPVAGEIAVANEIGGDGGRSWRIYRYLPPYLMGGDTRIQAHPVNMGALRSDSERQSLAILGTVIGMVRGIAAPRNHTN